MKQKRRDDGVPSPPLPAIADRLENRCRVAAGVQRHYAYTGTLPVMGVENGLDWLSAKGMKTVWVVVTQGARRLNYSVQTWPRPRALRAGAMALAEAPL